MNKIKLRFYEELNNHFPVEQRKVNQEITIPGNCSIKEIINFYAIPIDEVDLIIANSESVDQNYIVKNDDQISVYPVFESFDISAINKLRKKPLRKIMFILTSDLKKLSDLLSHKGFDCKNTDSYSICDIVNFSKTEKRIILTMDKTLLKNRNIDRIYIIKSKNKEEQYDEVLKRFDLNANY